MQLRHATATCVATSTHLKEVDGLHQPRRREEEGRVEHAPRRRDHLAAAAVQRLRRDRGLRQLKLDIAQRLVAQGPLFDAPLEALHNGVARRAERVLVLLVCMLPHL